MRNLANPCTFTGSSLPDGFFHVVMHCVMKLRTSSEIVKVESIKTHALSALLVCIDSMTYVVMETLWEDFDVIPL